MQIKTKPRDGGRWTRGEDCGTPVGERLSSAWLSHAHGRCSNRGLSIGTDAPVPPQEQSESKKQRSQVRCGRRGPSSAHGFLSLLLGGRPTEDVMASMCDQGFGSSTRLSSPSTSRGGGKPK